MRRALRITLWIIAGIFFLLFVGVIFINTKSGKSFVRDRTIAFLSHKLKTEVHIGEVDYKLPKWIVMKDVLFRDQAKDTMLSAKELRLDIAMFKLLNSVVSIQKVYLDGAYSHLYRRAPDTAFNFDYVMKAFLTQGADTTGAVTDTTAKLALNIDNVVLHNVRFHFDDYTGGNIMRYDVGDLTVTMKSIDPEKLVFIGNKVAGNNIRAVIISDKSLLPEKPDTSTIPLRIEIGADEISLQNVYYNQQDLVNQFYMDIRLGRLLGHPGKIDIANQRVDIKDFLLENTTSNVRLAARSAELAEKVADTMIADNPTPPTAKWIVTANNLNLNNVGFILNNETERKLPSGLDFNHLNIQGLVLDANQVYYSMDTITGNINHLVAKEQSGLDIRELKTNFAYTPQGGYLRDLYLQTSNSILQNNIEVKYPSLDAVSRNFNLAQLDVNLVKSIVGLKDVLIFAPQLNNNPFFRKHRNGMIRIETRMDGSFDALDIHHLYASGLGNTEIDLSGKINGMSDPNRLSYNLNISKFQSSRNDMETLLPPATLKQIRLPDRFGATGTLSGTTSSYNPNLYLVSSDGNATVKGNISMAGGKGRERYNLAVKTKGLNIGRILKQDTLIGIVTADINAKGQGFDINNMNATMNGTIHSAGFKRYNYKNISFNGSVAGKRAKVTLDSKDPNAKLHLTGTADFRNKYPAIYADADIDSIDFQALHFYSSELRMSGKLRADIQELNPDYPRGSVVVDHPSIAAGGRNYVIDSLYIVSKPSADSGNNIVLRGPAVNAHLWGHTPLSKAGDIIQYHIDRHYVLNSNSKNSKISQKKYNLPSTYDLNLIAKVENDPIIKGFLPEVKSFDTIRIDGSVTQDRLVLNADIPNFVYQDMAIQNGKVRVNGGDSALQYVVSADHFKQKSINVWYANASGDLRSNVLTTNLSIADPSQTEKYKISGTLERKGNDQVVHIAPGLMLNYKQWNVNQPNSIVFGDKGFYVQNFGISSGQESLTVNSQSPTYNSPLHADISRFLLSNITGMVSRDTLVANGLIGGNIDLLRFNPDPEVRSDLNIAGLSVYGDTIGDVTLHVKNASQKAIEADAAITGYGNNIKLDGKYYPTPINGNNFDMMMTLDPLNVRRFEGLAMHQIRNTSGYIRGDLKVRGTMSEPLLSGKLVTDSLSTNIAFLNSQFTMPHEVMYLNSSDISFDRFKILDSSGHPATITGNIYTNNFKNMQVDANLQAKNWQAMSSTPQNNQDFYGRLFISTNVDLTGPVTFPSVDGSLSFLKGTDVTVTVPERGSNVQESKGIVEFINMNSDQGYYVFAPKTDTALEEKRAGKVPPGSDVNLNVSIDPEAQFSVIIDKGAGDFVRIRGKADLNTWVAPDGTLGLVGTYEVVDGYYQLNYNFIRRLFRIEKGGTIVFSGDPAKADLNVTAVYEANIPPYDLVSRQVTDPAQLVYYKQRLPFEVQMKLSGPILLPNIDFDVVLPEEKNYRVTSEVTDVVQARLAQLRTTPTDLNKQVFSVIILNRFMAEDPFENGAGGRDVQAIARQSASRFISEQLNKFAGGLIEGLDLTIDVASSEDFTTGERRNRTDLSVGASKRLLNDRLKVSVGTDYQVEGPKTNSTKSTSNIPGNLAVDYDISSDRRYRVRFFRKNEELGAYEGYSVQTGASLIMNVDYDRFSQVFMSRKKMEREMEERMKRREERRRQRDSLQTVKAVILPLRKDEAGTQ
jgi:translocation and assembly module TamB